MISSQQVKRTGSGHTGSCIGREYTNEHGYMFMHVTYSFPELGIKVVHNVLTIAA